MSSFVPWSSPTVIPTLAGNGRWMNDHLVLPKKIREKKTNNHPLLEEIPTRKFLKKNGNHSKGLVLGLANFGSFYQSQPSAMKSFQIWFIVRRMDFFFAPKNPRELIFVAPEKALYDEQLELPTWLSLGLVHQTQSAEAGGSKLSGVARGKDRSCGAKVSSRA